MSANVARFEPWCGVPTKTTPAIRSSNANRFGSPRVCACVMPDLTTRPPRLCPTNTILRSCRSCSTCKAANSTSPRSARCMAASVQPEGAAPYPTTQTLHLTSSPIQLGQRVVWSFGLCIHVHRASPPSPCTKMTCSASGEAVSYTRVRVAISFVPPFF
ncbi:hypothetical protein D3C78_667260 [compost metagenome]